MADIQANTTMKEFTTNDQSILLILGDRHYIMFNGKRAYELKGKFLDDLHDNAFSGTNGEDAVEHIEYFLKINNGQEGVDDEEFSDVEKANNDDEQETAEIFRIETNLFDYETPLADMNLKEEALKQKAIYETSWGDESQSVMNLCAWLKKSFGNIHELDYELLIKLEDYWWKEMNR
ncbi:hypothetical protein Tco_0842247 [Tanacetum coccineum]|uniref:Uncharacterized protein n=1 Tax=Tanacetum coccineum TaxID=301880 RepID=A0ABQ5AYR7_9ASTR